jgi:tRNA (cytidine/uridine-2'-O-)-methyltransferase
VEPLGFSMDDKHMRRAGLDYHEYATVKRHADWRTFLKDEQPLPERLFALTTRASQSVFGASFKPGDYLVFGSETKGLSDAVRQSFAPRQTFKLPMMPGQRSLNLSNAVAVTVFEAWRQNSFANLTT